MEINWQQFGLKHNPYDTSPLFEGGELPLAGAFIGRSREQQFLNDIIASEQRSCSVIEGDVGVGKTSLANVIKATWKESKQPKHLFSFRREIEASPEVLTKKGFLLELMGSIVREIALLAPAQLEHDPLLKNIMRLLDIAQDLSLSAGVSLGGFGVDAGSGATTSHPLSIPLTTLEQHFEKLLRGLQQEKFIGKHHQGLIVHVNNFDVVLGSPEAEARVRNFFNEVRDLLQTPAIHWLFIGPPGFFAKTIAAHQRVKSIFYPTPLIVQPLSKEELIEALARRMDLLKSPNVQQVVKPFEDEVIRRLYDLFNGDIRSVMMALRDILGQYADRLTQTLSVEEALVLLARDREEHIRQLKLGERQRQVLDHIIRSAAPVTQKDVAQTLKKQPSNITHYYFRPLREANIIKLVEQKGRIKYWDLTEPYLPLREVLLIHDNLTSRARRGAKQLKLI